MYRSNTMSSCESMSDWLSKGMATVLLASFHLVLLGMKKWVPYPLISIFVNHLHSNQMMLLLSGMYHTLLF